MRIALITVPYSSAGRSTGEERAPSVLRTAGLLDALRSGDHDVVDFGDVPVAPSSPERDPHSGIIAPGTLVSMVFAVRAAVARATADNRFPIVVGGECPLLLGCLAAARDTLGRVGLLFVDGHEDAWPPHASTTGEAADMELGLALGQSRVSSLDDLAALVPLIDREDVVLVGPRDREEILAAGVASLAGIVPQISDVDVRRGDAAAIGRASAERLYAAAGSWWFHLDLDVLSTEALSAVRYPQPGGLEWDDLDQLAMAVMKVPGLVGWDLTIYNPDLDPDRAGAARIVEFVRSMSSHLARHGDRTQPL